MRVCAAMRVYAAGRIVHNVCMSTALLPEWQDRRCPLIGMVHLGPLPGAPRYGGDLDAVIRAALRDAEALVAGGADGLMIENFGDTPFYPGRVPAGTVAHMTRIAAEIRRRVDRPLGINVLRNDGRSALAVAHAVGARFIRVNVLAGARVADQGLLIGEAHELLRERALLRAESIRILADVNVKHSAALGVGRPLASEVADVCARGGADGLIVSGSGTGQATAVDELRAVKHAAGQTPVLVGSGVRDDNLEALLPYCDGLIVGTWLKQDGCVANPVDVDRVRSLRKRITGK